MTELLQQYHLGGLAVGLITFLIIGLFHPLVIKGEYYYGRRCRRWFLAAGIVLGIATFFVEDFALSVILGVTAFSRLRSVREVDEQVERVAKGWFPANPKRNNADNNPEATAGHTGNSDKAEA